MTAPLLKSQEILLVSSNDTTVNGDAGSGIEVVIIGQGVTGAILDVNVERVALNGNSSDFTFQKQGSNLVIISGSSTVATISIQADANGTQVTFNNGTVNVFAGQAGMTFGGVTVGTTAANITPLSIDPYLITSSTTPPPPPPVPGDTTPPTFVSAITNTAGTTVTLTFNEPISLTTAPQTAFEVKVDSVLRSIATISVSGTDVILTLAAPVYDGQPITVKYTDPTAGDDTNTIQDLAGNDAASTPIIPVLNNSTVPVPPPDTTPPIYQVATFSASGDQVVINYSETLTDTTTVPTSAFVVTANGSPVTVNSMHAYSSIVLLSLSPGAILKGQTVTVGYVAPGGSGPDVLKDLAGNPAATSPEYLAYNFSTVTNPSDLTLPILMGAFSGGGNTSFALSYNEPLGGAVVPPSAFTVTVNGSPVNVVSVQPIISNAVYLELASAVPLGSAATISYTDPGGANGIIDVAGNRAASYTNRAVYTGVAP